MAEKPYCFAADYDYFSEEENDNFVDEACRIAAGCLHLGMAMGVSRVEIVRQTVSCVRSLGRRTNTPEAVVDRFLRLLRKDLSRKPGGPLAANESARSGHQP